MRPATPGTEFKRPYRPLPRARATLTMQRATRLGSHALDKLLHTDGTTRSAWMGYVAAVLGVALASAVIALANRVVPIKNISLVYLLVVIWLAVNYGRGPAIFASFLAFLAYDFFFIPPLYTFTVSDPTEWLSLSALLLTSLVVGQLTSAVQARAEEAIQSQREAVASQQRTATLYSLAKLIASATSEEELLDALAARVLQVFASSGVEASAILLPDESGRLTMRTITPPGSPFALALSLDIPEHAAQATWAFERGHPVGGKLRTPAKSLTPQAQTNDAHPVVFFVPLQSRRQVVGVLGIAGSPTLRDLFSETPLVENAGALSVARDTANQPEVTRRAPNPQATLFAAFSSQMALALERLALQQQSIHTEALRESDRLKDALLSSVTHDLRTPLASIQAAAGSLLEPDMDWSDEDRRELLETIETSADRLNRLVSNILDLSRLEAGVALPEKRWYPFGDVIATVLDRLDLAGRTEGRHIEVDVPDDLPLVPMDHAQMEQVMTNLIENALKYSPDESIIRLQARVTRSGSELEVRVSDQGIGIPPNELQAIFTKFYRVQHVRLPWASTRPPTGTGLGLAISAAIIEAHGGHIWAESELGHGSTFIFTLPIPSDRPSGELPEIDLANTDRAMQPPASATSPAEQTSSTTSTGATP
ncbi:MAG TPA: ATP-binding protein [Ktedonobacterales bacterium]